MARGRIAELGAGPVSRSGSGVAALPCPPTALWGATGRSRPGERAAGDLDLGADAARRVVASTLACCPTAGCAVLASALGRADFAAALWDGGEG
jgi:hypothetical protein